MQLYLKSQGEYMVFDLGGVGRISAPQLQSVSGERHIGNHLPFRWSCG